MIFGRQNTLWFSEVDLASLIQYEVDVFKDGQKIGETQIIDKDDAIDGYDEIAGEMELRLNTLTALGDDAQGVYSFKIYSVNNNGRSLLSLDIEGAEIDFLLPQAPVFGGIR